MTPEQSTPQPSRLPDAVLRPAVGNVFEATVEQLATAIRLGSSPTANSCPPERELAERLGVSRNTLREAIAALRDSGLVTTRRGRGGGTVITYAGREPGRAGSADGPPCAPVPRWHDALDFRRVVEPGAAALAATRALAARPARLAARVCQGGARGPDNDSPPARRHPAAPGHRDPLRLADARRGGDPGAGRAARAARRDPGAAINIAHSNDQHDAVVAAILAGDADTARATMEEHCDATAALLRGLLG